MGKRGPKPAPTATKKARGNPGHRPLNEAEPTLPAADLTPPEHMGEAGLKEWNRLGPLLTEAGVLTAGDMRCFETYCRIVDDVDRYTTACRDVGATAAHTLGYAGHLLRLRGQLKQYLAELGGTPSSRSGVKVNHQGWTPKVTQSAAATANAKRKKRFFGLRLDPPAETA